MPGEEVVAAISPTPNDMTSATSSSQLQLKTASVQLKLARWRRFLASGIV